MTLVVQFCIKSALIQGAARVIAIDNVPERLALAQLLGTEIINLDEIDEIYPRPYRRHDRWLWRGQVH